MRAIAAAGLLAAVACAQKFEVATIKQAQMISGAEMRDGKVQVGMRVTGSRVEIRLNSLGSLIVRAYGIGGDQLVAPHSTTFPSWDISAKMPDGASKDQVPAMLQALLAERFKLKVHREMREQPVYALLAAQEGAKLVETPAGAGVRKVSAKSGVTTDYMSGDNHVFATRSGDDSRVYIDGPDGSYTITTVKERVHIEASGVSMARFARVLAPMFFDRHVVDQTGLGGRYEIALDLPPFVDDHGNRIEILPDGKRRWHHEALRPAEIRASLEKMGLRIEARRAQVEMLVVDHAEKEPTAN